MRVERFTWDGSEPRAMAARLRAATGPPAGIGGEVARIVDAVRERGDAALAELTERFDAPGMEAWALRAPAHACEPIDGDLAAAIELAAANVQRVAQADVPESLDLELPQGHTVAIAERPVAAAGIYVPGGRAAYPSSALMGCAPARAAGVERLVIVSPPGPDGRVSPLVMSVAERFDVREVYAIGGAQAIAALALGTETIEAVDVVAGPGNAWVTEAKRQLYGVVGIDGLAGPSEVVVVTDGSGSMEQVALDLLAQAEHGPDTALLAIGPAAAALGELERLLHELARERPSAFAGRAALVETTGLEGALALADAFAPEHLELRIADAAAHAGDRVAGCVFTGAGAATAFGDYTAGSNHVLPTGGAARFGAPLSPRAFMRRSAVVDMPGAAATALAAATDTIARAEGLPVHGESARARAVDS